MNTAPDAVREKLLATNEEFRRLKEDHSRYDEQLDRLARKPFQTEEEKLEEKKLKKLKLQLKDQMELMIQSHRS
jgi:uncharacterized protein YdcH (DUF465 family)